LIAAVVSLVQPVGAAVWGNISFVPAANGGGFADEAHAVPLEVSTLPEVPGATVPTTPEAADNTPVRVEASVVTPVTPKVPVTVSLPTTARLPVIVPPTDRFVDINESIPSLYTLYIPKGTVAATAPAAVRISKFCLVNARLVLLSTI
jgi:hypothetical protein